MNDNPQNNFFANFATPYLKNKSQANYALSASNPISLTLQQPQAHGPFSSDLKQIEHSLIFASIIHKINKYYINYSP